MRFSTLSALCVFAVAAATPAALAQSASRIGVINFQRAVVETAEFQKAYADLQTKYQPRQAALQKAQQDLQDLETQLRSSQGRLSSSGAAELQARGQRKQVEVDRLSQDLQADFEGERDGLVRLTSTRMAEILKKLADEKGLDMIIDSASGLVPYARQGSDVTDAAIAAYNAAYPAK
jgi:outer membrane protein